MAEITQAQFKKIFDSLPTMYAYKIGQEIPDAPQVCSVQAIYDPNIDGWQCPSGVWVPAVFTADNTGEYSLNGDGLRSGEYRNFNDKWMVYHDWTNDSYSPVPILSGSSFVGEFVNVAMMAFGGAFFSGALAAANETYQATQTVATVAESAAPEIAASVGDTSSGFSGVGGDITSSITPNSFEALSPSDLATLTESTAPIPAIPVEQAVNAGMSTMDLYNAAKILYSDYQMVQADKGTPAPSTPVQTPAGTITPNPNGTVTLSTPITQTTIPAPVGLSFGFEDGTIATNAGNGTVQTVLPSGDVISQPHPMKSPLSGNAILWLAGALGLAALL